MWGFFILCLRAMIIVAWNGTGDPSAIIDVNVFKKVLSVFIIARYLEAWTSLDSTRGMHESTFSLFKYTMFGFSS
ncbi:hypothetical protein ACSQ67_003112 [Phaseolus vulgaris]